MQQICLVVVLIALLVAALFMPATPLPIESDDVEHSAVFQVFWLGILEPTARQLLQDESRHPVQHTRSDRDHAPFRDDMPPADIPPPPEVAPPATRDLPPDLPTPVPAKPDNDEDNDDPQEC